MACSFPRCECMQHPDDCMFKLGHLDPRKGKTMNEHFTAVAPATEPKLTDEQLEKLLAISTEPVDGEVAYISTDDQDETEDQKVA